MSELRISVEGLAEFRKALRNLGPEYAKELTKLHREVAKMVSDAARATIGPRVATAIRPQASAVSAKVSTQPTGKAQDALVRIWGAKARTGWYARRQYSGSTPQHPKWVGNQWDPGEFGGMPYHVGPAINSQVDEIEEKLLDGYERISRSAFPD